MFPKPSFGSFYKFVVSVGLVLLALALAAPVLLLREPFDFLVSTTELEQLTDVAQQAIDERQSYGLTLARALPAISVVLGIAGFGLTSWGLFRWWKRQAVQDALEDTSLIRAQAEVRSLTQDEVDAQREIEADEVLTESESDSDPPEDVQPAQDVRRNLIDRMTGIESQVTMGLKQLSDYRAEVQVAVEAGRIHERIDLLLLAQRFERPDLLVEIKYSTSLKTLRNRLRELGAGLERARMLYQKSSGRSAHGLGLVVLPEEIFDRRAAELLASANEENVLLRQRVKLKLLSETSLAQMTPEDWASLVAVQRPPHTD